jgi:hypothetical protein
LLPEIACEWTMETSGTTEQIAERLASCLVHEARARPQQAEGDWAVYAIGSRARFRTWGLVGPRAYRRLPISVRTRQFLSDDGSPRVQVELRNDEGPYAIRLPSVEIAYQQAYSEIRHVIQKAVGHGSA